MRERIRKVTIFIASKITGNFPAEILSLNYTIPSAAKLDSPFVFPNLDPITLEIGLFLDSKLFEHFQRDFIQDAEQHLLDFSLALINNVHVLYQQPTLSPNLTEASNLATFVHKNGQAQSLLDAFCRHQAHINPGTDLTDMGHWDHGVLLTGFVYDMLFYGSVLSVRQRPRQLRNYDIYHTTASVAGVAPVARMCDQLFACSLVEGLHLGRSFVLAHEMGHNMGMVHDGVQNQCSKSCCLMSAWSCGVRIVCKFVAYVGWNGAVKTTCRLSAPVERISTHSFLQTSDFGNVVFQASQAMALPPRWFTRFAGTKSIGMVRTPGQRFTADQQCAYFWGRDYKVEIPTGRTMEDICRILWCGNGGSTISTAHPALEGSYCGGGRWCHEGQCLPWASGPPPKVVHGGWSRWSTDDRCPVQHCQISDSIAVRPQHRDCVNPAPNNGGLPCSGAAIRGILCSTHHSSCQGFTREEYSNRICSSIKHDPLKPDRQLTGEGFEHATQPCKVWCHLIDSELIRNKGQFPDGNAMRSGTVLYKRHMPCELSIILIGPYSGEEKEQRPCLPRLPECEMMTEWGEWAACESDCGQGQQKRKRQCLAEDCNEVTEEKRPCWNPGKVLVQDVLWISDNFQSVSINRFRWLVGYHGQNGRNAHKPVMVVTESENGSALFLVNAKELLLKLGSVIPSQSAPTGGCSSSQTLRPSENNFSAVQREYGPCPETSNDFVWEEWSEWSECSQTCGEGFQRKERRCRRGECPPVDNVRQRRCVSGPCPAWDEWTEWSDCPSCSSAHSRSRRRRCIAHSRQGNASCEGPSQVDEPCDEYCDNAGISDDNHHRDIELITGKGRRRVVAHGGRIVPITDEAWGDWMEWTECSQTCGTGKRRRTRVCIGRKCPPQPLESVKEKCNEQPCPGDSYWSPWTTWSTCSVTCGDGGVQSRRRACLQSFFFQCDGQPIQTRSCSALTPCEPSHANNHVSVPRWSEWSSWSSCTCFTLMESRRRFCLVSDPAVQGFCTGAILDQRQCSARSCAASPGGWSAWSEWSLCSKDCQGTGHQIRNRMCSEPLPSNSVQQYFRGSYCVGYSFDQRPCTSSAPCGVRVDGGWSDWSEWSDCGDSCVNAHRSRTRQFFLPIFLSAHPNKLLELTITESTDGEWSAWNEWSACVGNCGLGSRTRVRACVSPPPTVGGVPCFGKSSESEECQAESSFCSRFLHHADILDVDVLQSIQ
ncbi:thrombospondin type 1 domain protein [Cooperia oncophora]